MGQMVDLMVSGVDSLLLSLLAQLSNLVTRLHRKIVWISLNFPSRGLYIGRPTCCRCYPYALDFRHRIAVIYKTSWYSFYLPVACAARFCGIVNPSTYSLAQSILLPLGEYFQIQDDFLDAYAHPDVLGKIGTDIRDNKNTWLINKALEICSPEQRSLLESNYGRKDPEAEAKVKV